MEKEVKAIINGEVSNSISYVIEGEDAEVKAFLNKIGLGSGGGGDDPVDPIDPQSAKKVHSKADFDFENTTVITKDNYDFSEYEGDVDHFFNDYNTVLEKVEYIDLSKAKGLEAFFANCINLTEANTILLPPEGNYKINDFFNGCSKLSKVGDMDISGASNFYSWLFVGSYESLNERGTITMRREQNPFRYCSSLKNKFTINYVD